MTLEDYQKKRDFRQTPEPQAVGSGEAAPGRAFVIHRHEARNLHYDLRLEQGGALCSWAVPKGFSFDPKEKRLAMRTEDHPLAYTSFEGVIPKGQYGAGTMQIWDRGRFELVVESDWDAAVAKGELKFLLFGRKLRGEWHMVKTQAAPNSWLLFKSKDCYAGPPRDTVLGVSLAAAVARPWLRKPKSARPAGDREPFSDPGWSFELEFAGRRLFASKQGDQVQLGGLGAAVPALRSALGKMAATTALIDGVLVAVDAEGRPDPELLEARLAAGGEPEGLQFYAFDLLYFDEFDLRRLPQRDRKAALRALLPDSEHLLFVDHVPVEGEQLAAVVAETGLPGVIGKRMDAAYGAPGAWVHIPVCGGAAARGSAEDSAGDTGGDTVEQALSRVRGERPAGRVRFSNLDKVYWPAEGYTKGDLIAYYERIADVLIPHMQDRPVHMLRYPDGIDGKSFYQRQAPEHLPEWFQTVRIPSHAEDREHVQMVCTGRDALLALVNLGSIDLHPWLSRCQNLESPDVAVIDLDPKSAPFRNVVRVARVVGRILRGIGLRPYLKTSGKTGLHIFVPLAPGYSFDQSRMFCEAVARAVCREVPDLATVERGMGARGGRVYVDFLQNRRGQTLVPCYAVRPVPGAQVSTPLAWDELDSDLHPSRFTLQNVPSRVAERGDLFLPVLTEGADLLPAIDALAHYLS